VVVLATLGNCDAAVARCRDETSLTQRRLDAIIGQAKWLDSPTNIWPSSL
jgi:hypothetical protein